MASVAGLIPGGQSGTGFFSCIHQPHAWNISSFSFNEGQVTEMMLNPSTDLLQNGMHSAPQLGIHVTSSNTVTSWGAGVDLGPPPETLNFLQKTPGLLLRAPLTM